MAIDRAIPKGIYLSFIFSLIFPYSISADSVEVHFSVNQIQLVDFLKSSLPVNAEWSFSAIEIDTGKKLIDSGSAKDTPLIPGSIVKLLVTAAILDLNTKENIELDTGVAFDGSISEGRLQGNLYLKGSGNVFLSEKDLRNTVEEIISRGIREIAGDVIADDSLFDTGGWKGRYEGPAYSTPDVSCPTVRKAPAT